MTVLVRALLPDFSEANPLYASAQIDVYTVDPSTHLATVTHATLYDAIAGGGTLSNPLTLDNDGKWMIPPYADVPVIMHVSGATVADHSTGIAGPPANFSGQVNFTGIPTSDFGETAFTPLLYTVGGGAFNGIKTIVGDYYKIGRLVNWQVSLHISTVGSGSGEFYMSLNDAPAAVVPTPPSPGAPVSFPVAVNYTANFTGISASIPLYARHSPVDNTIRFRVGSPDTLAAALNQTNLHTDAYLVVAGSYVSAA